jgi:hypothetical protein
VDLRAVGCGSSDPVAAVARDSRRYRLSGWEVHPRRLAGALLIGLAGNAIIGAWWLDPAIGLLIAAVAVKEGAEACRGDGCR